MGGKAVLDYIVKGTAFETESSPRLSFSRKV